MYDIYLNQLKKNLLNINFGIYAIPVGLSQWYGIENVKVPKHNTISVCAKKM